MTSRSLLAILPAFLCLGLACGSNVIPAGGSGTTTSSGSGSGAAPTTSTGMGGNGVASGGASTAIVSSASAGGTAVGGAGGAACSIAFTSAPILLLPARAGNLDLAGPSGMGLTVTEAEQIDCPCAPMGTGGGSGAGGSGTGGQSGYCELGEGAIGAPYSTSNQIISQLNVWGPAYFGTLSFKSRDMQHSYTFAVSGQPVQRDGQWFQLAWDQPDFNKDPMFDAQINELYDALTATFAPSLPQDMDCQGSGACIVGSFGDVAYMGFPKLGLTAWIASLSAGQPTCSTFNRLDLMDP